MSKYELITPDELASVAREARSHAGLTQAEAAQRLGVAQSNISKAENDTSGRYARLQCRMISELAGWECRGPLWRVARTDTI